MKYRLTIEIDDLDTLIDAQVIEELIAEYYYEKIETDVDMFTKIVGYEEE